MILKSEEEMIQLIENYYTNDQFKAMIGYVIIFISIFFLFTLFMVLPK